MLRPSIKEGWKAKIGDYEIRDNAGNTETPAQSQQRAENILGQSGLAHLYTDTKQTSSTIARETFIDKLIEVLEKRGNTFLDKGITNPDGSDIRESNPAAATISLEELLGKDGAALYKAAIAEERESKAFREAVFLQSLKHYPGSQWSKRLILWIAGPSGSGKSYSSDAAIKKISTEVMGKKAEEPIGNNVVFIDGGIERNISQMRQLVLQVALQKGYTGISDLHQNTKLKTKKYIKKAALSTKNLSLAIPCTFTSNLQTKDMKAYAKMPDTLQIFSEVVGEKHNLLQFQKTVEKMGTLRAWKNSEFDEEHTTTRTITMNNLEIECESKEYHARFFYYGRKCSALARNIFREISREKISLKITNDLMFVKLQDNDWVICDEDYTNCVKMAARDFRQWQNYKEGKQKNVPASLGAEDWLKYCREHQLLSPLKITLKNPPSIVLEKNMDEKTKVTAPGTLFALHSERKLNPKSFLPLGDKKIALEPLTKIQKSIEDSWMKFHEDQENPLPISLNFQLNHHTMTVSSPNHARTLLTINKTPTHEVQCDFQVKVENDLACILLDSLEEPILISSTSSQDILKLVDAAKKLQKTITFDQDTCRYIAEQKLSIPVKYSPTIK